jgi:hypothetical protein
MTFQYIDTLKVLLSALSAKIAVVINPPLHIGLFIQDVGDSGAGDEKEDLAPIIHVADSYEVNVVDGGGEDETRRRRKGPPNVL